jgi:3-(3-hydroxy-phenyl)propionate hydroxylase
MSTLPVIIVGAGPVGLSLLVALLRQGVHAQLYEALPELSPEARASTFHPSTLEMFAEWQVLDAVVEQGHRVDALQYWERENHQLIAEFHYHHIAQDTPYPFRLQCPQNVLTRTLKPIAENIAPKSVFMQHQLTHFENTENGVRAYFDTPNGQVCVEGAYLCACDGSRSVIRKQLNIAFDGSTYLDRFLLVACDVNFKAIYPDFGSVSYIFDPDEWVIVMQLPDVTRTVFQVHPHEQTDEITQPASIIKRMQKFAGQDLTFTIHNISTYSVHQRVASDFRVGRVILVGDAAHINNPMGGMGMNSGIHDAHCLAPRLAHVLQSHDDTPLDEYQRLRRTFALEHVRKATDKNYQDMSSRDEAYRQKRNADFRAIAQDPVRQRAYLLKSSMLEERI